MYSYRVSQNLSVSPPARPQAVKKMLLPPLFRKPWPQDKARELKEAIDTYVSPENAPFLFQLQGFQQALALLQTIYPNCLKTVGLFGRNENRKLIEFKHLVTGETYARLLDFITINPGKYGLSLMEELYKKNEATGQFERLDTFSIYHQKDAQRNLNPKPEIYANSAIQFYGKSDSEHESDSFLF